MAPPYSSAYSTSQRHLGAAASLSSSAAGSSAGGGSPAAAGPAAGLPGGSAAPELGQQALQHTPVLITRGTADAVLPHSLVEHSVQFVRSVPGMGNVELCAVPGKAHGMVQGKAEMGALMRFWSRHLSRRPTDRGMCHRTAKHTGAKMLCCLVWLQRTVHSASLVSLGWKGCPRAPPMSDRWTAVPKKLVVM
jgi:hypothetical protein